MRHRTRSTAQWSALAFVAFWLFALTGCSGPTSQAARRGDGGVPSDPSEVRFRQPLPQHAYGISPRDPQRPRPTPPPAWEEKKYPPVTATVPAVPNAVMLNDDSLCSVCHEAYVQYHRTNIHRDQSCETCHGPGSVHVKTRGTEPNTILSFKKMQPAEAAEACLKCHEQNACVPGQKWRTSPHAHANMSCVDCHKQHYNVPPGTPATKVAASDGSSNALQLVQAKSAPKASAEELAAIKAASNAMGARDPQACFRCHQEQSAMAKPGHPHQIGGPLALNCASCHDPHGSVTQKARTEMCLQCHKGHPESWGTSKHAEAGLACVSCHNPHAATRVMGASDPQTCYKCHEQMQDLERVAHPHQIGGRWGFNCGTCHNPHGNVNVQTRTDQCLKCHKGAPTIAWHSNVHAQYGVACADCHNPHPNPNVQQAVDIQHTNVWRDPRMPMSVFQPLACYRCHPKVAAQFSLPSHHPVLEGKMVCSDCHDSHGQADAKTLLREPTTNLTCFRCHAEKQGPFVWQHPPVEENCSICHNAHGAVANNLLHQPVTFLCLRCHSGHREFRRNPDKNTQFRQPFYTDCTQCHAQVHGSDLPAATLTPRLTR